MSVIRRILVPTDFSRSADRALDKAIELARAVGAAVELAHVSAPVLVLPPPLELVAIPQLFPDVPRRIQESLAERVARAKAAGVACESIELEGHPHQEIVRHADDTGVDLIVMGTHGQGGLAHAVLGSVAERVLHRAACPVLVVPERERPLKTEAHP
jgi:nucleotide-binding universal stress UspA family protein